MNLMFKMGVFMLCLFLSGWSQ